MSLKRPTRLPVKVATVHSLQQAMNSLTVPAYPRTPIILQQVPEHGMVNLQLSPSLERERFRRNEDWNNLQRVIVGLFQKKEATLVPGELSNLHDNIRNILVSKAGPFIFDYYKQELLPRGMIILREEIKREEGDTLLKMLEITWQHFFKKILPSLESILYLIKVKENLTIRQTALVSFRDIILLKIKMEEALASVNYAVTPGIKHMLLILQGVNDSCPPNKNKLKLESMLARVVVPFLGFKGLYDGGEEPIVTSMEPIIAAKRKSLDWRRISRPLSIQPQQAETLTELFLTAVRKQQNSSTQSSF